ncbi:hypothetical protein EGI16_04035 [Chryseobacterium sp. G0240]|nr:hypothetical protein EGI16_04035 [Chryseobacterium sp. G0240]
MRLLIFLTFLSIFFNAQVIKDTIAGNPKFVKESVVFLNESNPFTFMKGDDEYGHAVIMTPKNLRERMRNTWFETDFCRYINNETSYDKNRNIIQETWYYRSGKIVDDYVYTFDSLNRLTTEIIKNEYSEKRSRYWYDKDSKTADFEEYYSKWKDEPAKRNVRNMKKFSPLFEVKFDTLSKTDSIFAITNSIWKSLGNRSYTRSKDSVYYKKLSRVKVYNNQYRVIEEKFFNYEDDYENKKVYLKDHFKYEYDVLGNITKKTNVKDGKYYSYIRLGNGKTIKEEKNGNSARSSYTVYTYTPDQKLKRKTVYYNDKVWHDIRFEYKGDYITRLFYLDKFGREDEEIEPVQISFKYKFDKQKNWIEVTKNVNGKDLYKWLRKIEYYD